MQHHAAHSDLTFAEEDPVALQACENNLCQDSLRGVFLQPFGAKALAQPPMPGIQSTVQSDYPMCAESIAGHTQSKHSGTKRSTSWPVQSNLSGQTVEDEATMQDQLWICKGVVRSQHLQDTRAPQGWTANMPAVGRQPGRMLTAKKNLGHEGLFAHSRQIYFSGSPYERHLAARVHTCGSRD